MGFCDFFENKAIFASEKPQKVRLLKIHTVPVT